MQLPIAITKQPEINAAVSQVEKLLSQDVQHIRFDIAEDWSGDWAIFFRVLVSDEVAESGRLREVARRVESSLTQRLDFSLLGLLAYFNFRTVSEQAALREPSWA
jgi:hypothetical protein